MNVRRMALACLAADLLAAGAGLADIAIETVPVGDPDNAADTRYAASGRGSVSYTYEIGKCEVTAEQYTAFLNAVAATDAYGLYDTRMRVDYPGSGGCGIERSGALGSYAYSVPPDRAQLPVNWVNFWDSLRFANWMENGQRTGVQDESTTEDGSYALGGYTGTDGRNITRKAGARWVLPTEDEWYKAAYYKGAGQDAGYWFYPTRTDLAPSNDLIDPDPGNNANFYGDAGDYTTGPPYYVTAVGEFEDSEGPYGTYDQGGNLREWSEDLLVVSGSDAYRPLRGGAWDVSIEGLQASLRESKPGNADNNSYGFRLAYVPEPTALSLLALGGLAMVRRRRR